MASRPESGARKRNAKILQKDFVFFRHALSYPKKLHFGNTIMLKKLIDLLDSRQHNIASSTCKPGDLLSLRAFKGGGIPMEHGVGTLLVEPEALHVYAAFEDSDIGNSATENNTKTWTTGDVLECFVQPDGSDDYYEFHVTPEGITLQLHLPPIERFRTIPFEQEIFEAGLTARTQKFPERNLWCGELVIPFQGIGLKPGKIAGSRFAICRYNYNRSWSEPEISSTGVFPGGTFHCPSQWHIIQA